jgi:hypothetical protein
MTHQDPLGLAVDDVPDAHGAVEAPGYQGPASRREGTDGMVMALQVKHVERVLFHALDARCTSTSHPV